MATEKKNAPKTSGVFSCGCRDCFEVVYGMPGDFCSECEDAGCEPDKECCAPGEGVTFG